jgi:hypothetical protein
MASRSKSTVSASPFVNRDGLRRNGFPAEHVKRALSAVGTKPLQFQWRVEEFAEHRGQLVDVGGADQPCALVVGADHLGQRPGTACDDRRAAGHRLHSGQRETLVQRRDTSDFGRCEQVSQLGVGDPARAVHDIGDAEFGDELFGRSVRLEFGDQLQFEVPFHSKACNGVQQVAHTLERHVGAGDRDDPVAHSVRSGLEQFGVHSQRHHVQLVGRHREILFDVGCRRRGDGQQLRDLLGDLLLHLRKSVPPANQRLAPPPCGRHVEDPVPGDRVVHGCHHRKTQPGDRQQTRAKALVVVDDVEVVEPLGEEPGSAQAERLRLGKTGRPRRQQLQQIDPRLDLVRPRDAERVGLAVQIQAGHLGQPHPRVEHLGVWLSGEHLDVVAEFDKPAGQMPDVDALAATMGFAPVGQQCDAHGQLTTLRRSRHIRGR